MTKRRLRGEGSIYFDSHAKLYVGQIDLGPDDQGRRRRPKVTGRTKTQVANKLQELRANKEQGVPVGDGKLTVGEWLEHWLRDILPKKSSVKSPNTIDNYAWAVRKHLIPALGSKRLRSLDAEDVDKMLSSKAAGGMAKNSLVRLRSVLHRALKDALARRKVSWNAAAVVDVPDAPTRESRSFTVEEAKKVLARAKQDRLEALVLTGVMVGPRPGELLGLPWDNVDLDAGRMAVTQTLKQEKTGPRIGDVKTPRSRRVVDLPAPVVEALRRHKARQAAERLVAGPLWEDWGLVFTTAVGTPINPSNLRRMFGRITERAGLGHWRPYELRHSAYSLLAAAGVPEDQLTDLMGHRDNRMGRVFYRHQVTPSVDAAVKPMEEMFGTD